VETPSVTLSRAVPGFALVVAVAAAVVRSGSAITAGHPAYLVWLVVVALLGVGLVTWAFAGSTPKSGTLRAAFRWLAAAAGLGLAAATFWLAPYPADPAPPAATQTSSTGILLEPDQPGTTGVAFMPGALVDPRAYQSIFEPVVQAGYPVYIAKPPLGIAFTVGDIVADARAADPQVSQWVVAGHSLGGAVVSGQTQDAAGLILLGSFPIGDQSSLDIPVLSISGSEDGLSTPDDIQASKDSLPAGAEYVEIQGGTHAFFGDYGEQRGDGQATISREQAQAQIQQAMLQFLSRIPAQQP
jgi:pimeloyl-ACP methyl ester carboxylesterase